MNRRMNDLNIGNTFTDDALDIRRLHFIDAYLRNVQRLPEHAGAYSVRLSFGECICYRPFHVGRSSGNVADVKAPTIV